MSGRDENLDTRLEDVQKQIENLIEQEKSLEAEKFNLPTAEKIEALVSTKDELDKLTRRRLHDMRTTVCEVERDLIKSMIIPLLPTLTWEHNRYSHAGGYIRAVLPTVIRETISPLFSEYHEVMFELVTGVEVIVTNNNIALSGDKAIDYAIQVLSMDKTFSEGESKKYIEQRKAVVRKEQKFLDSLLETHKKLYG